MTGEGEAGAHPRAHWVARRPHSDDGAGDGQVTADALMALGGHQQWVLHDCPWPGRPLANIDHIVVGVSGVHVLDTKNWSGEVAISAQSITHNGHDRQGALASVRTQQQVIQALVAAVRTDMPDLPEVPVVPYLVLTGRTGVCAQVDGVLVVSVDQVARVIADGQVCVPQRDVPQLAFRLIEGLDLDRELTLLTLKEARKQGKPRQASGQAGHGVSDEQPNRFLPQRPVRSAMPRSAEKYADSHRPQTDTPTNEVLDGVVMGSDLPGAAPDPLQGAGQRGWRRAVRRGGKVAAAVIVVWFIAANAGVAGDVTQWLGDVLRG